MGSKSYVCKNLKARRLKIHALLTVNQLISYPWSELLPYFLPCLHPHYRYVQICLCCYFSGGKCLRSAVLFYFYYISWIYSVCLLYFSYSHYLWVLFFVSCSGRVFWAVYLISQFTIHSVLRSATIFVTFSTTISLWK